MFKIQILMQLDPAAPGKTWRDVHPTNGPAYTFATREEAESMREMCYGDCDPSTSRVAEA